MAIDRAKNNLKQARSLSLNSTSQFRDFVGQTDRDDLYRFKLNDRSSFNLSLSNIRKKANVDVALFSLKGAKQLKQLGKTSFSDLTRRQLRQNFTFAGRSTATRNRSETLNLTLEAGEYYLRVYPRTGNTNYRLTLAASPVLMPPNPPVPQPSSEAWLRQFGGAGSDAAYGTFVDRDGNVYVSGTTSAAGSSANAFVAKSDSGGSQVWFRSFDVSDSGSSSDIAFDVAADSAGNYYVAGATNISDTSADGFVAKYNSNGDRLWRQLVQSTVNFGFSIPAGDAASGIALSEASGTVSLYVSGFWKAVPPVFGLDNPSDAFVAKYTTNLGTTAATTSVTRNWFSEFGGSGSDGAADVAIDTAGNVYITGITNATLRADLSDPFTQGDAFVAKFNGSGQIQGQAQTLGVSNSIQDYARSIAVDGAGNVYITGQTDGTLPGQTSAGGRDGYVAKYVPDSTTGLSRSWLNQFGTASLDEGHAIAVDAVGNVYLAGKTSASLFGNLYTGGSDIWFAQYNSAGARLNSRQLGSDRDDDAYGIAVDSLGNLYLSGQTQGSLPGASSLGGTDGWVGKFLPF